MASCYLVWFFCGTQSCPFSRIFLGRRLIFEELRKPIKKEGALDFKVFRSFVICHFNYLKEHLIVKRCASLVSLYSLAPTRRMGEFKTVMQILNDFVSGFSWLFRVLPTPSPLGNRLHTKKVFCCFYKTQKLQISHLCYILYKKKLYLAQQNMAQVSLSS